MHLTFGLFGPLEVRRDGHAVPFPGGRQRALLALLLLAGGEVVRPARLVNELWPEHTPPSAGANLRTYLSGVRGWLDRLPSGPRLARDSAGWRIAGLDGGADGRIEVDVAGFEADLREGRRVAREGDHAAAAILLCRAVSAARGAPLQDVPQGPALADRARVLSTQWLAAVEDYGDTLLILGRTEEVRLLLWGFLAEHRYRERGWGQLMIACYRDGDPAGALEAYRSARAALADGLGLEPGAGLVALHRAVLRRDPALDGPALDGPASAASWRWTDPAAPRG